MKRFFIKNQKILLVLILALILRLWNVFSNFRFGGDYAWYYLSARDFILNGNFPLVGIPSSLPYFYQGAIWTWLLSLSLVIGNFHPYSGLIFPVFLNIYAIYLSFLITKKVAGKRFSLYVSLFLACSPLVINNSQLPFESSIILPALLTSFYLLLKAKKEKDSNYYFYTGLSLAITYQIYIGSFVFIVLTFLSLLFIKKPKTDGKNWLYLSSGFVVGSFPLIIWDIKSGYFMQTLGYLYWFIAKTLEIFDNVAKISGKIAWKRLNEPLLQFYFSYSIYMSKALFYTTIGGIVLKLKNLKKFPYLLLILWIVVNLLGFLLRGYDNKAFYPIFFYPLTFFMILFLDKLVSNKNLLTTLIFSICIVNGYYFIRYGNKLFSEGVPSYKEKLEITDKIIKDSGNDNFDFEVIAHLSWFEAYDDDFEYLFWWKGKKITSGSKIKYRLIIKNKINENNAKLVYQTDEVKLYKILYD